VKPLMMDEILRSNYPVDEWSKVMTALGQNPGCSELFDMDIALMPINEHLNGDHVELGIENQESSWQPHGSRKFMKTKEPARPLETKTMKPDQAEKPIEKTVLLQPADVIEEVRTQPDEVCQGDVPVPIAHLIDQPVEADHEGLLNRKSGRVANRIVKMMGKTVLWILIPRRFPLLLQGRPAQTLKNLAC
jgi:hypothetical protein